MLELTQRVVYEDELVLSLDQERSLVSDVGEVGLDVDLTLAPQLLQHRVNDDVCSSSAHSSTAVNKQR